MKHSELIQCHVVLKVMDWTYDLQTTDSPFLRMIQLAELLKVPAVSHRIAVERLAVLPRFPIKTTGSPSLWPQQFLNWCDQIDYLLLGLSNEQYSFVISRSTGSFSSVEWKESTFTAVNSRGFCKAIVVPSYFPDSDLSGGSSNSAGTGNC